MSNFDAKILYEKLKQSSDFEEIDYYIYEKFPPVKYSPLWFASRHKGAVGQIYFNNDGLIIFRSGTRLRRFLPKKITKGVYIPTKEIRNATIENKSLIFYLDEKGIKKYEEFCKSYWLIFPKSLNKDMEKLDSISFFIKNISKAKDIVKLIRFNVKSRQKIKTESLVKSKVKLPQKIKTESKSDSAGEFLNEKSKDYNKILSEDDKQVFGYLFNNPPYLKVKDIQSITGFDRWKVRGSLRRLEKKKLIYHDRGYYKVQTLD